ncbi:MAG: response regulator [Spirochaetales bacterium]|nr:response regulator [Spirochaetales bacterium]
MKKILVVDDSSVIRMSLEFFLKENDFDVVLAEDGAQGATKAEAEKFNLIITDINMPNMNGIDMISKIRTQDANKFVPILVLTTESDSEMLKKGKEAGATGWIVKPFTNEDLLATVQKVIK